MFIRWRLLDGGGVVVKEEMSIRHLVAPISVDPSIRSLCRHVQTRANWLEWKGGVSSSLIDFNGVSLRGQSLVQAPIRRTLSFSTLGRMSPLRVLMSRVDSELELSLLQFLHSPMSAEAQSIQQLTPSHLSASLESVAWTLLDNQSGSRFCLVFCWISCDGDNQLISAIHSFSLGLSPNRRGFRVIWQLAINRWKGTI